MWYRNTLRQQIDQFEDRLTPAGNIVASLGEVLQLRGDDAANALRITQDDSGTILIEGFNGTTINNKPTESYNILLKNFDIDLLGGNDRLEVNNLLTTVDQAIKMGAGDDKIELNGVKALGDLGIRTSDGFDQVTATNLRVKGDFTMYTGRGDSVVQLYELQVENLTVIGQGEADVVTVSGAIVGENLNIDSSAGDDRLNLIDVESNSIWVNTGAGDDWVMTRNVHAFKAATFLGGDGFNTFEDLGLTCGVNVEFTDFSEFV